ncbi:MAG: LysR family transcriptional regulator [Clostridia bacterium]|nr:LysR family transcriptional regulator [Clostridia bacterium]
MEIRLLKYFLAVAREESITSAAARLHITQPTLSKQLMDFEEELGCKLFERGKRKITLTEEGMFLRERAQEIIELSERTESLLKMNDKKITGDICIGCGETQGMREIIKVIKIMHENYPDIRIHFHSGNGEDVSEKLDKGLVDFGLFVGNSNLDRYNYIKLKEQDTWGLLVRKDDKLAQKKFVRPEDLKNVTLLCSRQALINNEMSGWLGTEFNKLKILSTHNLLYNASLMVEEGLGSAISIDGLVNTTDRNLLFLPFEPTLKADLVFAWKKYQVFSKPAELFLEYLQEYL